MSYIDLTQSDSGMEYSSAEEFEGEGKVPDMNEAARAGPANRAPRAGLPKPKKKRAKQQRARNYVFTLNGSKEYLLAWGKEQQEKDLDPDVQYLCFQMEKAPTTGQLHMQGYVELTKQLCYDSVKKVLNSKKLHLKEARGTGAQNRKYCSKKESAIPDTFVERGEMKAQGKRTDIEAVIERIQEGATMKEILLEFPRQWVMYTRGINAAFMALNQDIERGRPKLHFFWGPPGCGKSRYVRNKFKGAYWAADTKEGWMDGYNGESVIVFDDFVGKYPRHDMIKLCDYGQLKLPFKGGYTPIKATTIVFTSNLEPFSVYPGDPAWARRINEFAEQYDEATVDKLVAEMDAPGPTCGPTAWASAGAF